MANKLFDGLVEITELTSDDQFIIHSDSDKKVSFATLKNYCGSGGTKIDLSTADVTLNPSSFEHIGSSGQTYDDRPDTIVVLNGVTLVKDSDYIITYSNNSGTITQDETKVATAAITGIGNYTGTKSVNFNISLTKVDITPLPYEKSTPGTDTITLAPGTYQIIVKGGNGGRAESWKIADGGGAFNYSRASGGLGAKAKFTITLDKLSNFAVVVGTNGSKGNPRWYNNYMDRWDENGNINARGGSGTSSKISGIFDKDETSVISGGGTGGSTSSGPYTPGMYTHTDGSNGSVDWGTLPEGESTNTNDDPYVSIEKIS